MFHLRSLLSLCVLVAMQHKVYSQLYTHWYILSNGVDTVDCGPSKSPACKTLDWILTRFHNTSAHYGAQTLSLITDTNLTVNQSTNFQRITKDIPDVSVLVSPVNLTKDITFAFFDIFISVTNWTFYSVNLRLEMTNMLPTTRISLTQLSLKSDTKSVSIHNSTFGMLNVGKGYNVVISDCVFHGNERYDMTLIDIENASLKIFKCEFDKINLWEATSILKSVRSQIYISKCIFKQCNVRNSSIILFRSSFLHLQKSIFLYNQGTCIRSERKSITYIYLSDFSSNKGLKGSCLRFSDSHSATLCESRFLNNTYPKGGAIFSEALLDNNSSQSQNLLTSITVNNSLFMFNSALVGGAIFGNGSNILNVMTSSFVANQAEYGGAICLTKVHSLHSQRNLTSLNGHDLIFTENIAENGGAIYSEGHINITSNNITFSGNGAEADPTKDQRGGAIYIYDGGILNMKMSHLIENRADSGGAIFAYKTILCQFIKCKFNKNSVQQGGGAIYADTTQIQLTNTKFGDNIAQIAGGAIFGVDSQLNITNVEFKDNTAYSEGGSLLLFSCITNMQNTTFVNNTALVGGAISCVIQSILISTNDTFCYNYAKYGNGVAVLLRSSNASFQYADIFENTDGYAIELTNNSALVIRNVVFRKNTELIDANMYSFVNVVNSILEQNRGGILIRAHSELSIQDTTFQRNNAVSMVGDSYSKITIEGSKFTNEGSSETNIFLGQIEAHFVIMNSVFKNLSCPRFGGAFEMSTKSNVIIQNCTFEDIFSFNQECIFFNVFDNVSLFINNTVMRNHTSKAIVRLQNSRLLMNNSVILDNINGAIPTSVFMYAINSSVALSNCSYSKNNFSTHIGLLKSTCKIMDSQFYNNSGPFIFYVDTSKFTLFSSKIINNTGLMMSYDSSFLLEGCRLQNNNNFILGIFNSNGTLKNCLMAPVITMNSNTSNYLDIRNTTFDANYMYPGKTSININNVPDIRIQDSKFRQTEGNHKGIIRIIDGYRVRIANSIFQDISDQYVFSIEITNNSTLELLTSKSEFIDLSRKKHISTNDKLFFNTAINLGMLTVDTVDGTQHVETPYASVHPIKCNVSSHSCHCYYNTAVRYNVLNCSQSNFKKLPSAVPRETDWFNLVNSNIPELCTFSYNNNWLKTLNLKNNSINSVCKSFYTDLKKSNLKEFNLANNKITRIPSLIQETDLQKIWLGGNPFHCDCHMTWMIKWLKNCNQTGTQVVADCPNVKCYSGKMIGRAIHLLTGKDLECFPSRWTKWQKIGVGFGAASGILLIVIVTIISRKYDEIKFFVYYYLHLDIRQKDDKHENLDDIKYDAFVCYSYHDFPWVKEVLLKNKRKRGWKFPLEKKYGYKFIAPNRDFMIGTTIRANVTEAVTKSRRIIIILSRNFLKSKWGMEEFKMADALTTARGKNCVIIVLKDKVKQTEIPKQFRKYLVLKSTYIDGTTNTEQIEEQIRFRLPYTPLRELKPDLFKNEYDSELERFILNTEDEESDEIHASSDADISLGSSSDEDVDIDDLESDQELPIIAHRQDENRNHSQQDNDTDTNDDGVHDDITPEDSIPMLELGNADVLVHVPDDVQLIGSEADDIDTIAIPPNSEDAGTEN